MWRAGAQKQQLCNCMQMIYLNCIEIVYKILCSGYVDSKHHTLPFQRE